MSIPLTGLRELKANLEVAVYNCKQSCAANMSGRMERLQRAATALIQALPAPQCHVCGKPATCLGTYEGHDEDAPQYACDECCAHGNEDGWCIEVAPRAALSALLLVEEGRQVQKDQEDTRVDTLSREGTGATTASTNVRSSTVAQRPGLWLTFSQFSDVNRERCESAEGFNHALPSWSTSDWFTAILGELGEAANVAKKLNRYRDGIPGNKESEAALRDKLRKELGDVFVYLDLLCQLHGFNIGDAAVEVFNAKSDEIGCSIHIGRSDAGAANQQQPVDARQHARDLRRI